MVVLAGDHPSRTWPGALVLDATFAAESPQQVGDLVPGALLIEGGLKHGLQKGVDFLAIGAPRRPEEVEEQRRVMSVWLKSAAHVTGDIWRVCSGSDAW